MLIPHNKTVILKKCALEIVAYNFMTLYIKTVAMRFMY